VPTWTELAAIAGVGSTVISLTALAISASATRTHSRVADFNGCLHALDNLAMAQRRIRDARDETVRIFEIREILNLMEALALLINRGRVGPSTQDFVTHFLEEAWAWLNVDATTHPLIEQSLTSESTFEELRSFARTRAKRISALSLLYKNASTSSTG
jgi:hypothetical protein